jgi:hypothetical protein
VTSSTHSDQVTRAPTTNAPRLSLVLCSPNDNFQGDSLWRLETTLNHAARQAGRHGRLDDLDLVAGSASSESLRNAVCLTDEASHVARFLTAPPELAKEKWGDATVRGGHRDQRCPPPIARRAQLEPSCWPEMVGSTSSTIVTVVTVAGKTMRYRARHFRAAGIWRRLRSVAG